MRCSFDNSLCKNRRLTVERGFVLSSTSDENEDGLLHRIEAIDTLLDGLSNMDKREGYGPYDDLDAIPRVLKEDPVYVRGSAGVTLRSARFDNNVGIMENIENRVLLVILQIVHNVEWFRFLQK